MWYVWVSGFQRHGAKMNRQHLHREASGDNTERERSTSGRLLFEGWAEGEDSKEDSKGKAKSSRGNCCLALRWHPMTKKHELINQGSAQAQKLKKKIFQD